MIHIKTLQSGVASLAKRAIKQNSLYQAEGAVFSRSYSSSGYLSRNTYKEPEYGVQPDTEANMYIAPSEVVLPYLRESQQMEMWKLHSENPEEWTIAQLSQKYGASIDRVKAVITLLRAREEMMAEKNVLNIPDQWKEIYKKYTDFDPEAVAAEAAAAQEKVVEEKEEDSIDGVAEVPVAEGAASEAEGESEPKEAAASVELDPVKVLAKEYSLSESAVNGIIESMKWHSARQQNLDDANEYWDGVASDLEQTGVDTNFRETAVQSKRKLVTDDYYPALFGDDGFEAHKQELLHRLSKETKAHVVDVDPTPVFLRPNQATDTIVPSDVENKADVKTDGFSRWKFAFRDLSKSKTQPTMIRTRKGKWRQATLLEEAKRSWIKNPSKLDMEVYRERIKEYLDPDGDEQEAKDLILRKTARRKAQLAEPEAE